jgi:large subunit ribosomal protein L30
MPLPFLSEETFHFKKFLREPMSYRVRVTQVRSSIGWPRQQKETLRALGLRHRGHTVEKEVNLSILGMLKKVAHLVKIERV